MEKTLFFLHNNITGTCYRSLAFGKASAHSKFKNYCQQTLRRGLLTSLSSLSKTHNTRLPHDAWCRSNILVPLPFRILKVKGIIGTIKRPKVSWIDNSEFQFFHSQESCSVKSITERATRIWKISRSSILTVKSGKSSFTTLTSSFRLGGVV